MKDIIQNPDLLWKKKLLFSGIFIQENKLHAIYDRYNDMSCKQWLLMAVTQAFDNPPDLTTLAKVMGCSRQNVKKLALHLQKNGYITLEKSPKDARSLCVIKTKKGIEYTKQSEKIGNAVHQAIFKEFSDKDIELYFQLFLKMSKGIENLELYFQNQRSETR